MLGSSVGVTVYRDSFDAESLRSFNHTTCNLPTVGDQNFVERFDCRAHLPQQSRFDRRRFGTHQAIQSQHGHAKQALEVCAKVGGLKLNAITQNHIEDDQQSGAADRVED